MSITILFQVGCNQQPAATDIGSGTARQHEETSGEVRLDGYEKMPDSDSPSRRFAILIGINQYADSRFDTLQRAVNDARSVRNLLVDEFGYQSEAVLLLENQSATKKRIEAAVTKWLQDRQISNSDSLFFFFAGHGEREGYLATAESRKDNSWESWVDLSWLVQRMKALPCRHKLLILDSCYSGALFQNQREIMIEADGQPIAVDSSMLTRGGIPLGNDAFQQYAANPCFLGISAGRHTAVVDEMGEDNHSLFTWALLESMKERALMNRADQKFLGRLLAADIERRVASLRKAPQRVDFGYLDNGDGDFVFEPTRLRKTPAMVSEDRRKKIKIRLLVRDLGAAKVALDQGDSKKAEDLLRKHLEDTELANRFDLQFLLNLARAGSNATIHRAEGYQPILSLDGKHMASRRDQGISLAEISTGQEIGNIANYHPLLSLDEGKKLLARQIDSGNLFELSNLKGDINAQEFELTQGDQLGWVPRRQQGNRVISLQDNRLSLWETRPTLRFLRTLGNSDYAYIRAAISGDGRLVAAAEYVPQNVLDRTKQFKDKRIVVIDARTGESLATFDSHQSDITALEFSPDNQTLAVARARTLGDVAAQRPIAGDDVEVISRIRLYQPRTGEPVSAFDSFRSGTESLAFSPDGSILVAGNNPSRDNLDVSSHHSLITFYDLWSGQKSYQWEVGSFEESGGQTPAVYGLSFSPNGKTLVVEDGTGTYLWGRGSQTKQVAKEKEPRPLVPKQADAKSFVIQGTPVQITPSGKYIDSFSEATDGSSRKIRFQRWNSNSGKLVQEASTSISNKYDGMDWKPFGGGQIPVIWFDLSRGERAYLVPNYHDNKIYTTEWQAARHELGQLSWSPDTRHLLRVANKTSGAEAAVWDVVKNRRISRLDGIDRLFPAGWTPNGKYVIGGLQQSLEFVVCHAESGKQLQRILTNGNYTTFLSVSGNGQNFVAWSEKGTTAAHGLGKYSEYENYFEGRFPKQGASLAVNQDGSMFATGHEDGSVWLWDFETQSVLHSFSGTHSSPVRCLCITKQGQLVSASHEGVVEVRTLPTIDREQFYSDRVYSEMERNSRSRHQIRPNSRSRGR